MIDILKGLRYFLSSDANDFKHAGVGAVISDDEQKKILAEESLLYECAKCGYRYDKHIEHFEGNNDINNKTDTETSYYQTKENKNSSLDLSTKQDDARSDKNSAPIKEQDENPIETRTKNDKIISEDKIIESPNVINKNIKKYNNEEKGVNTDDVYVYQEKLYQFNFSNEILEELSVYKSIINNVTYEKNVKTEKTKTSVRNWLTTLNVLESMGSLIVLVIIIKYTVSVVKNQFETLVGFN